MKKLFIIGLLALGFMSYSSENVPVTIVDDAPITCIEFAMNRANEALASGRINHSQYFHYVNFIMSLCEDY